jgi:uncharacterized protein (TIRG00374 family)
MALLLCLTEHIRFYLCLLALGVEPGFIRAAIPTVAGALGSLVGIVPAGLGVREFAAGALGAAVGLSPEASFMAALLMRVCGLAILVPTALALGLRGLSVDEGSSGGVGPR